VFCCLLGEPRAEGLTRIDPLDLGRLLGLDRAPEVRTLRRRTEELAAKGRSARLIEDLARRHLAAHEKAAGIFYVDGHVRAYHGGRELPKAHVARIRLAMPAELDTWVADANGDGVLVWSAPPGASLVAELRLVTAKVRQLVGDKDRPTICFDRGGWSPKLFKELGLKGFEIITYRKGPAPKEPHAAFKAFTFTDGQDALTTTCSRTGGSRSATTVGVAASPAARSPASMRRPAPDPDSSPRETTVTRARSHT